MEPKLSLEHNNPMTQNIRKWSDFIGRVAWRSTAHQNDLAAPQIECSIFRSISSAFCSPFDQFFGSTLIYYIFLNGYWVIGL